MRTTDQCKQITQSYSINFFPSLPTFHIIGLLHSHFQLPSIILFPIRLLGVFSPVPIIFCRGKWVNKYCKSAHLESLCTNIRGRSRILSLGGGTLKKIVPSGGRCENFWGIYCEKSRFYAKKSYFSLF